MIIFSDVHLVFATNHEKAQAARQTFARILNATIEELAIDSDRMGTFSGEVERPGTMLDALRGKVCLAREVSTSRFVLVSEGSFGSVGGLGFAAHGIEMLMVHDAMSGVEVLEQYISWDTNYASGTLVTEEDLRRFLERISFGSHALVLYPQGVSPSRSVYKGIVTEVDAYNAFHECKHLSPSKSVVAMSDMRAHLNPTRMRAISKCCELLAHRLATTCKVCSSGGFGLVSTIPGLVCRSCGMSTQRAMAERHACVVCNHAEERPRADGITEADPSDCEFCNP